MDKIITSIEKSLFCENWYSALVMSLVLPDICAKLEGNKKPSSKRYSEWFAKYLGDKYDGYLSGNDCYALRCAFLHEGTSNTETQKARDALDRFIFLADGSHCNRIDNCYFGDPILDGKQVLLLSTKDFCQDMIAATREWLDDPTVNKDLSDILEIHENGFSIGRAITFK